MNTHPILLDTNLLILFIVGTASRKYISMHKKLTEFTVEDYDTLVKLISCAPEVLFTPNTLTETSNLLGYIKEPARSEIYKVLQCTIATSQETYIQSRTAAKHNDFIRLGLTDTVLVEASSKEIAVLTTDFNLYQAAITKGTPAINFNHLRDNYM